MLRDVATRRPLTLVFTAGGAPGLAAAAGDLPSGIGGAIVVGGPPATLHQRLSVIPYSTAGALAPAGLRVTVEAALAGGLGIHIGDVGLAQQFARIALPLTVGAQGPLLASGVPAVLVTAAATRGRRRRARRPSACRRSARTASRCWPRRAPSGPARHSRRCRRATSRSARRSRRLGRAAARRAAAAVGRGMHARRPRPRAPSQGARSGAPSAGCCRSRRRSCWRACS